MDRLMRESIAVCLRGIEAGESPFGAVIATREGRLISSAHNTVRATCDPTAHAEVNAIREACRRIGGIDLSGHVMATTCEPCPMCAAAMHWARLDAVCYGATIDDARRAGFNELPVSCRSLYELGKSSVEIHSAALRPQCAELFQRWLEGPNPMPY